MDPVRGVARAGRSKTLEFPANGCSIVFRSLRGTHDRRHARLTEEATWRRVEAALSSGELVGFDEVERHETHMSVVVIAGDVVYKLKKPVDFGFADYSTPERRLEMCRAEIELNRRLAPSLYLGIAAVLADDEQLRLVPDEHPDALEHLVLMERVDERDLLHTRLDREDVPPAAMRALGETIARFHLSAAPAPAGAWSLDRIRADLATRFELLRTELGSPLDVGALESIEAFLDRWLRGNTSLLAQRERDGWVRDGHGDLRAEHVVLREPLEVIDCVEFSAPLRQADVLSDVAFLVMELHYAERPDLAEQLYTAWADAGCSLDERLLWIYAAMRALIRVEVALLRAEQLAGARVNAPDDPLRRSLVVEHAQTLLLLAEQLTWSAREPAAILLGGLSGSGKSTIGAHLARRWGVDRLSSDQVRKAALGLRIGEVAPAQAYESAVSLSVYETLGMRAGAALERGHSVLVDATFRRELDSQAFQLGLARATTRSSNVICVGLTAEADRMRARVEQRARTGGSDATVDVLERQLAECPARLPVFPGVTAVSTDGTFSDAIREVDRVVLDAMVPEGG